MEVQSGGAESSEAHWCGARVSAAVLRVVVLPPRKRARSSSIFGRVRSFNCARSRRALAPRRQPTTLGGTPPLPQPR